MLFFAFASFEKFIPVLFLSYFAIVVDVVVVVVVVVATAEEKEEESVFKRNKIMRRCRFSLRNLFYAAVFFVHAPEDSRIKPTYIYTYIKKDRKKMKISSVFSSHFRGEKKKENSNTYAAEAKV